MIDNPPVLLMGVLLVLTATTNAFAACSNPTGAAGNLRYSSGIVYFCNNTAWVSTKGASQGSCAGTTAGTIRYSSNIYQFCDATEWFSMQGASMGTTCAGQGGRSQYGSNVAQFCNGTNWYDMTAPCAGTSVGGYCWYGGGAAESCDTVCNLHGGCNSAGTVNYAGSSGTLAQCESVLIALGMGSGSASDWDQSVFDPIGVGCFMHHTGSRHRVTPPTTTCDSGGIGGQQRACACGN